VDSCLIDAACYAGTDLNPANDCEECDPATPLAWSFRDAGQQCDDGDSCTGTGRPGIGIDTCNGAGVCAGVDDPDCNDTCPFAIEAMLGVTLSNNDNRGPDDAEASCQADSDNDVWFVFSANCSGDVLATTTGSTLAPSNDLVLSVWNECPLDGGLEIACDDDGGVNLQAAVTFVVVSGEDFYLRVAGFEDNSGDIMLNLSMVDDCSISGICYQAGEQNPSNACQACVPAISTTGWSSTPEGSACGSPADTVCDSPDACDGDGVCETNPKPDGTDCPDDENVCTFDTCAGGVCAHPPTPSGTSCGDQFDGECDNPDSCDGAGGCLDNFEAAGFTCGDQGSDQCNNPDICNGDGMCDDNFVSTGTPCDDGDVCTGSDSCSAGVCAGVLIPIEPIVLTEGPKGISIVVQPVVPAPAVALIVRSPDWPCLEKYVGSLECGGDGEVCGTDADCNHCSYTFTPCLIDADCDYGVCTNGWQCNVSEQNCADASPCVRQEFCVLSGETCSSAPARTIDVNGDGLADGLRASLVDDPGDALILPLEEWTSGVMRCSRSSAPCATDGDCPRGMCGNDDFCNVAAQDCLDGTTCVLNEVCLPGRVFLSGPDLVPSTLYEVSAECGSFLSPAGSGSTCLWADVTCDGFVNVTDVQLSVLGVQSVFVFATLTELDIHPCHPQGILNVSDIQRVILAIEGQTYEEAGCPVPCP
jgi:hypothetical protein